MARLSWGGGTINPPVDHFVDGFCKSMFLIPAGLPHATQRDLSKTLLCHLVCLGNESQLG